MEPTPGAPPAPPATAPPKARVAWWRRVPSLKRLILFSIFVFGIGAITLVGGFFYIQEFVPVYAQLGEHRTTKGTSIFDPFKPVPGEKFFKGQDRMNILVLGIDYNQDSKGMPYSKGARSDTMMIVSVSPQAEYLNILSIPRDTYVQISASLGMEKINAAYSYGGIKQTIETVEQFTGVSIDHYVIVKVQPAKKVLDVIGGVPIDVEKNMDYDDNWGQLHIHLKKGPQILNGEQAVGYARFRKDEEGDRGRMRRQQQTIKALVSKLKDPSTLMKINELAKATKAAVETDIMVLELADLAMLYKDFEPKKVRGGQIVGDDQYVNEVAVIIPYGPENQKTIRRLLKDSNDLTMKEVRVQILNGSTDPQAAERLADRLNLEGFDVVKVEKADKNDYKSTQVIEHIKNPRVHGRLKGVFDQAQFREMPGAKNTEYDVTIIVGSDQILVTDAHPWPAQPAYPTAETRWEPSVYEAPRRERTEQAPAPAHQEAPEPPAGDALPPPPGEEPQEVPAQPEAPPPAPVHTAPAGHTAPPASNPAPDRPAPAPVVVPVSAPAPAVERPAPPPPAPVAPAPVAPAPAPVAPAPAPVVQPPAATPLPPDSGFLGVPQA